MICFSKNLEYSGGKKEWEMIYWKSRKRFMLNERQRHKNHGDRSIHRSILSDTIPEPLSLLDKPSLK